MTFFSEVTKVEFSVTLISRDWELRLLMCQTASTILKSVLNGFVYDNLGAFFVLPFRMGTTNVKLAKDGPGP